MQQSGRFVWASALWPPRDQIPGVRAGDALCWLAQSGLGTELPHGDHAQAVHLCPPCSPEGALPSSAGP